MRYLRSAISLLFGTLCCLAGNALAQLPTTPVAPASLQTAAVTPAAETRQNPEIRADVIYRQGQLDIAANGATLRSILQEVTHQSGMKITGAVSDERIFGRFGPGTPARVLSSLLNGTGTNMVLMQAANGAPLELTMTPRVGGAAAFSMDSAATNAAVEMNTQATSASSSAQGQNAQSRNTPGSNAASAPNAPPAVANAPVEMTPEQQRQHILQMQQQQQAMRQH